MPVSTVRLSPMSHQTPFAHIQILSTGYVCLTFSDRCGTPDSPTHDIVEENVLMKISPDGLRISVTHLCGEVDESANSTNTDSQICCASTYHRSSLPTETDLQVLQPVGNGREEHHELHLLPAHYHCAYNYTRNLVKTVASATPKVTLFVRMAQNVTKTDHLQIKQGNQMSRSQAHGTEERCWTLDNVKMAKCTLMEDGPCPHFEVLCDDDTQIEHSIETGATCLRCEKSGCMRCERLDMKGNLNENGVVAPPAVRPVLEFVQMALKRCLQIEQSASVDSTGDPFPIICHEQERDMYMHVLHREQASCKLDTIP